MGTSHSHSHALAGRSEGHARKLRFTLALTGSFLGIELAAAWLSGSLALLSDAAHMFTDAAALAIALVAIRIGQYPADRKRSFGYYRFEILAAAFNAALLFLVAGYILWEAYQRLREPSEILSVPMLIVGFAGLVVNFISLRLLAGASAESLNVKGAYLEVWSDLLGSVGVMIAAAVIWLTGWTWVDSLVAALIGLWVLPRTWRLLADSLNILLPVFIAGALYAAGLKRRGDRGGVTAWRHASFFGGLAALLVALQSPLDALAEHSFVMHQVQHLFLRSIGPMLLSGLFFFWRVLDPRPAPLGAGYGTRIVMSWAAIAGTVPLGAYIALKSSVLYPAYDVPGRLWDIAALADEQLGGFVIWIPGSMMFVVLLLIVIRMWGARESRLNALWSRGIAPQPAPPSERAAANRGLALRLAAIAAVVGAGVVAVAILQQFVP